jgi:hypothetical protein
MPLGGSTMKLSKQLQDLHIDPCFQRHIWNFMRGFFSKIITFIELTTTPTGKAELPIAVRKRIIHNHVDLPLLISVEATGVNIPVGNDKVLLATVYKSPGHL